MSIIILHIIIKSSGRICQKTSDYLTSHVDAAYNKIALELLGRGRKEKGGIINENKKRRKTRKTETESGKDND
jgi:hypothetical protein